MKGDQCEFCEGEMEQRRVLARFCFKGQTIYVENVPAWVCNKCGEQYFDASVYKHLEKIAWQREQIQRIISFPLAEFDRAIA
ncbi:MAG: YgiT-type zinc finger protein [bacterium]